MSDDWAEMEKEQEKAESKPEVKESAEKPKDEDDLFANLREAKEEEIPIKKEEPKKTVPVKPNPKKSAEAEKKMKFKEKLHQKDLEAATTVNERGFGNQMLSAAQRQKIVEESDLKQTNELFGVSSKNELDTMCPTSEQDFIYFARLVAEKATYFKDKREYPLLVKEIVKALIAPLDATKINDVSKTVSSAYNEAVKKSKDNIKKKTNNKPMIAKDFGDYDEGEYDDDYDDYDDFM